MTTGIGIYFKVIFWITNCVCVFDPTWLLKFSLFVLNGAVDKTPKM